MEILTLEEKIPPPRVVDLRVRDCLVHQKSPNNVVGNHMVISRIIRVRPIDDEVGPDPPVAMSLVTSSLPRAPEYRKPTDVCQHHILASRFELLSLLANKAFHRSPPPIRLCLFVWRKSALERDRATSIMIDARPLSFSREGEASHIDEKRGGTGHALRFGGNGYWREECDPWDREPRSRARVRQRLATADSVITASLAFLASPSTLYPPDSCYRRRRAVLTRRRDAIGAG